MMTAKGNWYQQPSVDTVAPDAVVFLDNKGAMKRTITLQKFENNKFTEFDIDFMNYVSSITVSKGIEKVPGDATIIVKAPKHMMDGIYGSIRSTLCTMLEIEIYMKGRFVLEGEDQPQYYPVFWGVISNLSESVPAGDLVTVTITCQDMMRWLAITKINIQPSVYNASAPYDPSCQSTYAQSNIHIYSSLYVGLSTPGIIKDLVTLSTSVNFFEPINITTGRADVFVQGKLDIITDPKDFKTYNDLLMKTWQQKFSALASALFIYGFSKMKSVPTDELLKTYDVELDPNAYIYIYGSTVKDNTVVPLVDPATVFAKGAGPWQTEAPPIFASNFQNRLDVAIEAKNQMHFEFYQDVDGCIILKPQFYNMDTRQNRVYIIEDIDIINFNVIEDESVVLTRIDVTGQPVSGNIFTEINPIYGFAIDFDKLQKYGLRTEVVETNFLRTADQAFLYAQRELARRNSLVYNASMTIQGRPEIKLGYPIFVPSRDEFYYVTGIDHSFTFGGSFETSLTLTARRALKKDKFGELLKNLLVQTDGSPSVQTSIPGQDTTHDLDNPYNSMPELCDPESILSFTVKRPDYRSESLDNILKYQGTFRYMQNEKKTSYDPRIYQQVSDDDGFELLGNGYPFGKDLLLTEDLKIVSKSNRNNKGSEIASSMKLTTAGGEQPTLRYQQPLTLDQIQDVETHLQKSKSSLAMSVKPSTAEVTPDQVDPKFFYTVPGPTVSNSTETK